MKFLSLFAALLLEQVRPLRRENPLYAAYTRYLHALERQLNAGQFMNGAVAWLLAVLPLVCLAVAVYHLLAAVSPLLAWGWNIGVLYVTMGFRQFSHYFREIAHALRAGDVDTAREHLARWRGGGVAELTGSEIARVSIELALIGAHRHVFGPIAGFVVFGPAGALAYRLSEMAAETWRARGPESHEFARFAERFFFWYDWLPARLTAASFAIVGNFEDAVYCWRTQAASWVHGAYGTLLASGGGALGVRLGDPLHDAGGVQYRPELGLGEEADADYMQSTIGLIWRALVLWMFLIFVVTVAHSLG